MIVYRDSGGRFVSHDEARENPDQYTIGVIETSRAESASEEEASFDDEYGDEYDYDFEYEGIPDGEETSS